MPVINAWIKDEDYPRYLEIKSRGKGEWSSFIHNALNPTKQVVNFGNGDGKPIKTPNVTTTTGFQTGTGLTPKVNVFKSPKDAQKTIYDDVTKKFKDSLKLCKIHGTPLTEGGKCLQKGCKYA